MKFRNKLTGLKFSQERQKSEVWRKGTNHNIAQSSTLLSVFEPNKFSKQVSMVSSTKKVNEDEAISVLPESEDDDIVELGARLHKK